MRTRLALVSALAPLSLIVACSSSGTTRDTGTNNGNGNGTPETPNNGNPNIGGNTNQKPEEKPSTGSGADPTTCADAEQFKSYLGCDFWPTITYNPVDASFDFAAVISNPQTVDANITVTGPNNFSKTLVVKPGEIGKLYLPWVDKLKTMPTSFLTGAVPTSLFVKAASYHLVSTVPVVAYQFNPLEYAAGGASGPAGKDWSKCVAAPGADKCYSYSNDASLLLPSSAMTGNYRIYGPAANSATGAQGYSFAAITATKDSTTLSIKLSATGNVAAGPGVTATTSGGTMTLAMNAGDVALLQTSSATSDLSGSLLKADKPLQVITGSPCTYMPYNKQACDHVEESLFPAETLGKHYYIAPPTGPKGDVPGMLVRLHGNVDNTQLTYLPSKPAGCPDTINAGQSISCGNFGATDAVIKSPFEVTGTHEFAASIYQLAGELTDPNATLYPQGDPSQSQPVAVEQYRSSYSFLTPNDYAKSFVDIVSPTGTVLMLDGAAVSVAPKAISSGYELRRLTLTNNNGGAHKLTGDKAFGIQVSGYGENTSYQYPGGLNLGVIASVPVQ